MKIFLTLVLLVVISCSQSEIKIANSDNNPEPQSEGQKDKMTWKDKFPFLWSAAYAADAEPKPEDVTYGQFVNAVKDALAGDNSLLNEIKALFYSSEDILEAIKAFEDSSIPREKIDNSFTRKIKLSSFPVYTFGGLTYGTDSPTTVENLLFTFNDISHRMMFKVLLPQEMTKTFAMNITEEGPFNPPFDEWNETALEENKLNIRIPYKGQGPGGMLANVGSFKLILRFDNRDLDDIESDPIDIKVFGGALSESVSIPIPDMSTNPLQSFDLIIVIVSLDTGANMLFGEPEINGEFRR